MPRARLNLLNPLLALPNACLSSFFTYHNDCEESDIELLTSFFNSSDTTVRPGLQLTNQNRLCDHSKNTHTPVPYPADPTAGEHEVRYSPPGSPKSSQLTNILCTTRSIPLSGARIRSNTSSTARPSRH